MALARANRLQLTSLRDRLFGSYLSKWVFLGALIGVVAGLGAILFFASIDWSTDFFLGRLAGYHPPLPRGEGAPIVSSVARPWVLPLVGALGGLLSGLIVFTLAPEAEGHGTDAAIEAFHERAGRIRARIPLIKLVASALTIGSGGSAGREGPTAQIAAGFGSWLSDAFGLSAEDRRIALAVGVGAGIGAIFKAPLGGALLSAEILYIHDFEPEAIVPGFIASTVGYTIFAAWAGWTPVFGDALGFKFGDPLSLGWYALLGVAGAAVGVVYVRVFYETRAIFHRIPLPPHIKPAIGGLIVGLIAIRFPEVLALGYGSLQFALEGDTGHLAVATILALIPLKILATSLTIGSGGSGGVFAPGLFIGGMVGAALWGLLHSHVPGMPPVALPFVVVGMGALFGGIAKAPIAVILMVAEMTGEFSMIVPAMIAVAIAYILTGNIRIYEAQVDSRGDSPAHRGEHVVSLMQIVSVAQAMQTDAPTVSAHDTPTDAERVLAERQLSSVPVVDGEKLVGMFTLRDAMRALSSDVGSVGEAMSPEQFVAYPTDTLYVALQRMARAGVSGLAVVEHQRPDRLQGFVTISDLARIIDSRASDLEHTPEGVRAAADDPLRYVTVEETMSRVFETAHVDEPVSGIAERLAERGEHAILVVDDDGTLVGIVTVADLERAAAAEVPSARLGDVATRQVIVARVGEFVADALAQAGASDARQVPVVRWEGGHEVPVGLLRRADVLVAYLRGRERLARATTGAPAHDEDAVRKVLSTEIPIERLGRANGLTLAELRLPRDAVITAVERDGVVLVPRGQLRLRTGDRVRVLSTADVLDVVFEQLSGTPR